VNSEVHDRAVGRPSFFHAVCSARARSSNVTPSSSETIIAEANVCDVRHQAVSDEVLTEPFEGSRRVAPAVNDDDHGGDSRRELTTSAAT
jgi:hypothetical protein